jgi:hypothetical protein
MNRLKTIDKTLIAKAIISKIQENEEHENIKVKDLKEFKSPNKITYKGDNNGYIPDIEAIVDKKLHVYSIELNNHIHTEKWRLLSLYAKKNDGHFYLVVPDFAKDEIKNEMVENNISAGLIYFET